MAPYGFTPAAPAAPTAPAEPALPLFFDTPDPTPADLPHAVNPCVRCLKDHRVCLQRPKTDKGKDTRVCWYCSKYHLRCDRPGEPAPPMRTRRTAAADPRPALNTTRLEMERQGRVIIPFEAAHLPADRMAIPGFCANIQLLAMHMTDEQWRAYVLAARAAAPAMTPAPSTDDDEEEEEEEEWQPTPADPKGKGQAHRRR